MITRGTFDDGGEKQRITQKPLDGFDENGREVPRVGKGRGEGSGMFEIRI